MPWKKTLNQQKKNFLKALEFNNCHIKKFNFNSWNKSIASARVQEDIEMANKFEKANGNYKKLLKM